MEKLLSLGSGYRTYLIVFILILALFAEKVLGIDIPGIDVDADWLTHLLGALGLGTLRAGISAGPAKD